MSRGARIGLKAAAGIIGAAALLGLNLHRDILKTMGGFDWIPVFSGTLHPGISSTGVLEAQNVAVVLSEVEETVLSKNVEEGQTVTQGQILLELSRTGTQLEFDQRAAALKGAVSDFRKAKRELHIQRNLLENKAVPPSQVEEAERVLERANANMKIAAKEFELIQTRLEGTVVRSPIAGTVMKDYAGVGTHVAAGKELIAIGDVSHFIVRTKVDELDIRRVHPGLKVRIRADAYPQGAMEGVVKSVATQAERETFAKVEVIIDVTDAAGLPLKHNLSVTTDILTDDIPNALGIPQRSVQKVEGDIGTVLVPGRFNLIRSRHIRLGRIAGDLVEVVSGLSAGERVGIQKVSRQP